MAAVAACHICLVVDAEIHNIQESNLEETFLALTGTKRSVWDSPLLVCGWCRAQLAKSSALRARCRRSQALLTRMLARGIITENDLRTLDRVAEKLTLNIKISNVYNLSYTEIQELVKIEDIKQETDFIENIFIDEPFVHDLEDANDEITNGICQENNKEDFKSESILSRNMINTRITNKVTRNTKARKSDPTYDLHSRESNARKDGKNIKDRRANGDTNIGLKINRKIKRRVADNDFLPDFDFEEFERKYDVKIDILSKEEQLREIEAKKMLPSYTLSPFGCEICGKAFATKQVYDDHLFKHSVSAGAYACDVCRVRFGTRSRALVHQDAHRLRFTCARCGFLTRTRFIAKNHFLSHTGTTHKCPHCEAVFSKYTSYLTHVRRRHPAKNTACDECGETFVGATGLRHHKTRAHRTAVKRQYKCSCGVQFSNTQALERHKASATENVCDTNLRPCASCGEGFASEESLQIHEATHATQKHPCTECNKTFVDARSFDTHVARVHLNIRVKEPPRTKHRPAHGFMCEQCGAECTSLTNLASHQRSHSGAKPHACPAPACALRFSSLHNMQRHHRVVHLGQRPQVNCTICGKLLAHAASLKLHVNTVHLKMPPPPRHRRRKDANKS